MSKGTYLHSERGKTTKDGTGVMYDGLVEGSSTVAFVIDRAELGPRAANAIRRENAEETR